MASMYNSVGVVGLCYTASAPINITTTQQQDYCNVRVYIYVYVVALFPLGSCCTKQSLNYRPTGSLWYRENWRCPGCQVTGQRNPRPPTSHAMGRHVAAIAAIPAVPILLLRALYCISIHPLPGLQRAVQGEKRRLCNHERCNRP